ncbi:hypothetical protein GH714_038618 [Hevea brasiliensis]|uniref:Aminotransferase class I/classII large domain-containing protein n=1 Tax=Hevea brasiliensis TaxID=3981 RepID=A0A6A6MNJ3_HEVBR|nr:hypothetical protein GH714_038618 [Hevea brasiliensis]
MVSGGQLLSKIATNEGHGENSPYFDGWKAYDRNPFHPTDNPDGVIQMGLAENQLSFDLIRDWIKQNPEASICTVDGVHKFKDIANFQDYHGLPEFRKAIAKFMGMVRGGRVTFDPDRVVMGGGATGANELIMFCLADHGDAFLVPTPYYPAFDRDLTWRTGVQIIPVDSCSFNKFQVTKNALEAAYDRAQGAGINVKGLIIANPSNPLGTVLERETLKDLSWHRLFINDEVVRCGRKMSSFGLVSSQTQYLLARMLSDEEFVKNFLAESSRRLNKRHSMFTKGLEQVGINCLKGNAGLYVWMDLHHLLKEPTFEGEMTLWRVIIDQVRLNVSPGSSFHCKEPGWFRVCFANMDDQTVEAALKRIRAFVCKGKEDHQEMPTKNKQRWQRNLRLSFSARRFEEGVKSPHVMSPHSPIPHSPLVRAK